jgi:ABC-type glycerol-3-phosphate transport system permease component
MINTPTRTKTGELNPQIYQLIQKLKSFATYLLLVIVSIIVLFPLLFSLSLAVQGPTVAPSLIPDFSKLDFGVFSQAFTLEPRLGRWILNSFVVSVVVTLGQLITSALAAYALATLDFPGKSFFFFVFLGTLMIPWEATVIPNYLTITSWGWKDSYQGLIVPFLASGFGIFLLRQYFLTIPRDLYEAATIDGCGRTRYLWSILLPLSRPALATLAVYTFLNTWNQYYWPLIVIDDPDWRTTQVGITAFRSTEIAVYNLQMAATLIVMLPTFILLILGQRQLVRGLTAGALKG